MFTALVDPSTSLWSIEEAGQISQHAKEGLYFSLISEPSWTTYRPRIYLMHVECPQCGKLSPKSSPTSGLHPQDSAQDFPETHWAHPTTAPYMDWL